MKFFAFLATQYLEQLSEATLLFKQYLVGSDETFSLQQIVQIEGFFVKSRHLFLKNLAVFGKLRRSITELANFRNCRVRSDMNLVFWKSFENLFITSGDFFAMFSPFFLGFS